MGFIKEVWLTYLNGSVISQILVIIAFLLILIFVYLLTRKIIPILKKFKKDHEKKAIFELKRKERKLTKKLTKDKEDVEAKLSTLKEKN